MRSNAFLFRAFAVVWLVTVGGGLAATARGDTAVYVVRHAEKHEPWLKPEGDTPVGDDAAQPLSAEGRRRAARLAGRLKGEKVLAVYYTNAVRTYETAAPLLDALVEAKKVAKERRYVDAGKETLGKRVSGEGDGVVLVVAHSHTIRGVLAALGANQAWVNSLNNDSYDNFIRVVIDATGVVTVEALEYPK